MILRPATAAILASVLLATGAPAHAATQIFPAPRTDATRYVDVVDFKPMAPKFLNAEGFLDPAYAEAVAGPSDVYTDFFGIQAVGERTTAEIRRDLVPRLAEVVGEDEHSITLKFKAGYTARFFPRASFEAIGHGVAFSHAILSGETWREIVANTRDLRAQLKAAGLAKAYLVPNPMFPVEQEVARRLAAGAPAVRTTVDADLSLYDRSADAVLFAPEGVHGIRSNFDTLAGELKVHRFDWIGMEMLPAYMQPQLDDFTGQPQGSPRYEAGRKALLAYFTDAWNGRAGPKTSAEDNYYFQLVDLARQRHARVIAMENVPMAYFFFRNGESAFGAAVRNHQWAAQLPTHGHGVVFGGSSHFDDRRAINIEDFVKARSPAAVLVSTVEIKPHKPS